MIRGKVVGVGRSALLGNNLREQMCQTTFMKPGVPPALFTRLKNKILNPFFLHLPLHLSPSQAAERRNGGGGIKP